MIAESHVEEAALAWLAELGYEIAAGPDLGPDGRTPERASYGDVVLVERLRRAIARLNPLTPGEVREEVLQRLLRMETPSLIEENRRLHRCMVEGVGVEISREDGTIAGDSVRLVDFDDPDANEWLAVNQVTVIENKANRRPDVVVFVNGLPLGIVELKNPGAENATLDGAYNQLQTYRREIPRLFRTNAVLVISDGLAARIGSLTADRERFMPWRTVAGDEIAPIDVPELETLCRGVFEKRRFLDLVRDFIVFGQVETRDRQLETIKIIAGYHQYHAVKRAISSTLRALAPPPDSTPLHEIDEEPAQYGLPDARAHPPGDKRIGVIWHTQGSGKSLLMVFYAGQLVRRPELANPTIVVITDRNDLDDQLFGTFSMCRDLIRQTPQQAGDREALRRLLDRPSGGVVFTTSRNSRRREVETAIRS